VLGLGLAQFGSPREAKDNIVRGVALGETLKNPSSLTFACMNAMTAYQIMGDLGAVSRLAQRMMEVADKFNLPPQRSIAAFMSGWLSACGDDLAGGLQVMETEFPRVSIMGPLPPFYAGLLASIRLEAARILIDSRASTLTEIAHVTGFGSELSLRRAYLRAFGALPSNARHRDRDGRKNAASPPT